ncbi:hypothetical protein ACOTVD_10960 [Campylobacter jejuni]|uniref:hypothetical protein n=1 Tax=Campylobacter jejuni TaxID=197 RepID=UPI003B9C2A9D
MQIPIYSKLKAKLESKGIDNISSGQIAWFVCSVGIIYLISILLYLYGVIKEGISLNRIFIAFYVNHFFYFVFMWFILLLNLFHKENTISLTLSILTAIAYFYNPYFAYILIFIICIIMYITKKQRWFYIYCIGLSYIYAIYIIFNLRGGFYK